MLDNLDHLFVNLSHILLSKIIGCLDDNIDRICFALVCKRWFNDREKYFLLNSKTINLALTAPNTSYICLDSFKSLILKSVEQKSKTTLCFIKNSLSQTYDFVCNPDDIMSMTADSLAHNLYKVVFFEAEDGSEISEQLTEHFFSLIAHSDSVKKLRGVNMNGLVFGLPKKLESVSMVDNFNQLLFKGCFPESLKSIKLGMDFDRPIEPGIMPYSLRKLVLGRSFEQTLVPGSLPPLLEVLHYSGIDVPIATTGVLPPTLRTMRYVPVSWMKAVKSSVPNLKKLTLISFEDAGDIPIDLSELPNSLTMLTLFTSSVLVNAMPTSIRRLYLGSTKYNLKEIFPDHSLYHFKTLGINAYLKDSLSGLKIGTLELNFNFTSDKTDGIRQIPLGVERLCFGYRFSNELGGIKPDTIPSSVKTVVLSHLGELDREGLIPSSVQHIVVERSNRPFPFPERLPSTLESITFPDVEITPQFLKQDTHYDIRKETKCAIRKLDDHHYLMFGHTKLCFIASLIPLPSLYNEDYLTKLKKCIKNK